jgi:Helix-turn-helix domain
VLLVATPVGSTSSWPPDLTAALSSAPPLKTSTKPPLLIIVLVEPDGLSFLEYVLAERLARACRVLMGDSTRSVSAVAFAAGFGDLSHFNRTFRRRFGCTPTEVRGNGRCDGL